MRLRSRLSPPLSAALAVVMTGVLAVAGARAADDPNKVPADPPAHPVLDPHYGDVLFEFYQGRYFPAITKLEVSQHFDRMQHHADEAEILRGGLLLSYGLHKQAAEVFEALLARGAPPSVRDRAWYFLAKIRYQRGLMPEAADALGRIAHVLPAPLEGDRKLLQANVLMATGDNAAASKILTPIAGPKSEELYARYNLGVALIRGGEVERGTGVLDELGRQPMPDEESRALRDKANVALGFAAMKAGKPMEARNYLQRVRLQGIQANAALLGFGWAADAVGNPKQALVPWLELAGRDRSDPSVLEAQLAVPYAYAELHADAQALQRYENAIANFETEDANIDATVGAIRDGKLVEGLMARNPGEDMGWFQTFRDLPLMPHAGLLTPVIAGNEFQEAFKNYRDLQFLTHNLSDWHDNLGVFGDMLSTRRQAFAERLPKIREQQQASGLGIEQLQKRSDANAADLKQAEDAADGVAFADANERELQERLKRVTDTLASLPPDTDPSLAEAHDRLRRVAGALAWQLAHEFPARAWDARKGQKMTEDALASARTHDEDLAKAQRDEPARFDDFARRIAELDARLNVLMPRVAALAQEEQVALQDIAITELKSQKERLAAYTAQARYAVAQLYDRATEPKEGDHADKP